MVVLANEKTILSARDAPADVCAQVIRVDQLASYLAALDATRSKKDIVFTFAEMESTARVWLNAGVNARSDLATRYEIVGSAVAPPEVLEDNGASETPEAPHAAQEAETEEHSRGLSIEFGGDGASVPTCPVCGAAMTKRVARYGKNKGNAFWGCSTYAKTRCRGIVNIPQDQ